MSNETRSRCQLGRRFAGLFGGLLERSSERFGTPIVAATNEPYATFPRPIHLRARPLASTGTTLSVGSSGTSAHRGRWRWASSLGTASTLLTADAQALSVEGDLELALEGCAGGQRTIEGLCGRTASGTSHAVGTALPLLTTTQHNIFGSCRSLNSHDAIHRAGSGPNELPSRGTGRGAAPNLRSRDHVLRYRHWLGGISPYAVVQFYFLGSQGQGRESSSPKLRLVGGLVELLRVGPSARELRRPLLETARLWHPQSSDLSRRRNRRHREASVGLCC